MPIVIDASSLLPLALDDEERDYAEAVVMAIAQTPGHVSAIFWWEMWNVMRTNSVLRKRISVEDAGEFLMTLNGLNLSVAAPPVNPKIFGIAVERNLSAYDASYLELAQTLRCPLATRDEQLKAACREAEVSIFLDIAA